MKGTKTYFLRVSLASYVKPKLAGLRTIYPSKKCVFCFVFLQ